MIYTVRFPQDAEVKYESFRYPAGETQIRFLESEISKIKAADKVHIIAKIRDGEIMGLALLIDAIRGIKYSPITLFLPYLPYGRADRPFVSGDCYGLHTFAHLINSMGFSKVVTLDAHSWVAGGQIDRLVDVSPKPLISAITERFKRNLAVLLPDEGARRYDFPLALQCSKHRDPKTGKLLDFQVPPIEDFKKYSCALIIDDICDGGRTFTRIAEKMSGYPLDLFLYVSHGLFSAGRKTLNKYFRHIYTTDSLDPAPSTRLTVVPCEGLLLKSVLTPSELWNNAYVDPNHI